MGLRLLKSPSVLSYAGSVVSIRNVMDSGTQGMNWSYQSQGGVVSAGRSYTNALRVITSHAYFGPIQIQQSLIALGAIQGSYYVFPLPELVNGAIIQPGPYEQDTGSFLHEIDIKQETDDGKQWICTFSYGPVDVQQQLGDTDAASGASNPLQAAARVTWGQSIFETSYPQDIYGRPFLNTVGDPIEDPPKREECRQSLSYVRNEANYNESYANEFRLKLNDAPFLGFGPNQVKIKSITGERQYQADFGYYWTVNYEFEFRKVTFTQPATFDAISGLNNGDGFTIDYGFEEIVLNQGFQSKGADGKITRIMINGQPTSNPMALSQQGEVLYKDVTLAAGLPPPYYLVFDNYRQANFSDLNIPQDLMSNVNPESS